MTEELALSCFGLLGILALLAKFRFALLTTGDQWGLAVATAHLAPGGTKWFHAISTLGSPVITGALIMGIAAYVWWRGYRHLARFWGSVLLSGDAVAWLIKQLVARPRPTLPVLPASGYSFPSGHVFNAMLLALVVWQLLQHQLATGRLRVSLQGLVGLGVLLILIARVVLRAHYPSDTVASLLLATSWWVQWRVWWPFFVWGHHWYFSRFGQRSRER
ncbi:hypothetical protein FD38_GL002416 [Levilactobacillus zymae DSM 19395]|nr:hypothetical protein FD38_GL002416 [Levilactobacillus zymae DSM 19395]